MTAAPAPPSWINKGQPKSTWPVWLVAHAVGRPEPNGSFMIRTKTGKEDVQARVLPGHVVFEWKGVAYTRPAAEVRETLTGLQDAELTFAPLGPKQSGAGRPAARAAPGATPPPAPPAPRAKHEAAKGSMPSIEWIQLDRLLVDDSYQRSIDTGPSRALIARIGREWDWRLCVPLMVSRRPDGLYVIDGQHRWAGARLRTDVPQLPCCISVYDGPADEAAMFVAANRERRAMNRLDDFHAAQAGGDEDALAVAALITSVGFVVSRRTGSAAWAPGEVAFTSAIAKARRRFGEEIAREALQLLAEAFPGERLVVGSSIFTATVGLLSDRPPDFTRDRALAALRTFNMEGWGTFISESRGGSDRAKALKEMLRAAYDDVGREKAA